MKITAIATHVKNASAEARADIAAGKWDEVMTDALYSVARAETTGEMATAREIAEIAAANVIDPAGKLYDYASGSVLRDASGAELTASTDAAKTDGGAGVIVVDGRSCYAQ